MEDALALAVDQALRSDETFRHGAVLLAGSRVLAAGRNRNANPCGLPSIHAEMDAAWRMDRRACPSHVVVVRLRKDGGFASSRPCAACVRALCRLGVGRMTYTTGDPEAPLATELVTCSSGTPPAQGKAAGPAAPTTRAQTCCTPTG